MKKLIVWAVVIVVIAASAVGYYYVRGKETKAITYRFERIDRGDVTVSISATGTLSAVTTVQVGTQVSGTIAKLNADFNSIVKEGQLLAQLDPTFYQAAVNVQRANVDRAQAQLTEAQRSYDRTKELLAKSMVSQADMDVATSSLQSAQASLRQNQASLDQATVNLKYTTILAPISGVVISRNVDVGQTVAASLSAPTLFQIANDLKKMQVQASVDEADIGQVKVGQDVTFRVDAYPDEVFHGTLSQVRLAPVTSQNVVTYTVIIDVDNPDMKLMPGMTATLSIQVSHRDNTLRVPLLALRFSPPNAADFNPGMRRGDSSSARPSNGDSTRPRFPREGGMRPDSSGSGSGDAPGLFSGSGGPGAQFGATGGGHFPRNGGTPARVWTINNGKLRPVRLVRGIQDSRYAEVVWTELLEGDSVIVGSSDPSAQTTTTTQGQNPFMPRMPGGGGRGGR